MKTDVLRSVPLPMPSEEGNVLLITLCGKEKKTKASALGFAFSFRVRHLFSCGQGTSMTKNTPLWCCHPRLLVGVVGGHTAVGTEPVVLHGVAAVSTAFEAMVSSVNLQLSLGTGY